MFRALGLAGLIVMAGIARPVFAAPLFVGTVEIDVEDAEAVERIVRHCADLLARLDADPAPRSETEVPSPSFLLPEVSGPAVPGEPDTNRMSQAIELEIVMFPDASEDSEETEEGQQSSDAPDTDVDLASIAIEDCQGAGLLP